MPRAQRKGTRRSPWLWSSHGDCSVGEECVCCGHHQLSFLLTVLTRPCVSLAQAEVEGSVGLPGPLGSVGRDERQHGSPRGKSGCVLWEARHPPSLKGSWEELLEALNFRAQRG